MYDSRKFFPTAAVILALGATLGCADSDPAALLGPGDPTAAAAAAPAVLVECPARSDTAITGWLSPAGGSLRMDRHELAVPRHGIALPTVFEIRAPAGPYMRLSVRGNGQDSFRFAKPARITIDYSRCSREDVDRYALTVWQTDPVTGALLAYMGGVDDKAARTVTFETDHLSTFSLAR